MKISLIAAMDENRLIGNQGQLPWHLSADLKHFKQLTLGKPVIMGRKTYSSIGKPLPGRQNIVITRDKNWTAPGVDVVLSLTDAIDAAGKVPEVMIIGGSQIYKLAMDITTHLYLTLIDHTFKGDTYFPAWSTKDWQEIERHTQQSDAWVYHFSTLERRNLDPSVA